MTEEKEKKLKLNLRKRDGKTARPAVAKDEDDFEENTEGRTTIHLMVDGSKPVFPGLMFPLPFASGLQADTLREANATDHILGFVYTLREVDNDDKNAEKSDDDDKEHDAKRIKRKELAPVGTTARIMRFEELPDGNAHGLFQGLKRFKLLAVRVENGKLMGDIEYLEEEPVPEDKQKPLFLAMQSAMRTILKLNPTYAEELQSLVERADQKELSKLADFTIVLTSASTIELQIALEELDVRERVKEVLAILKKEIIALKAKEDISREVDGRLSKQQHEFVLREQMRYIKEQLGIGHNSKSDEDHYLTRLEEIREFIPDEVAEKIQDEIDKLNLVTPQSPEYTVSRNYLDWLTGLPWNKLTNDRLDVKIARRILDRDHYGLEDVKKRILEFIGVSKLKGEIDGSIICLIGPPGVGKTSLGHSIAEAVGRKFFRFSLGGMRDEAEIKGHRRTYIGALPGKVIEAVKICGSRNPVIMLDEIDKMGQSYQGDPASALLEVLDPEQNVNFRDHYLDVPFDLSKVMFIATANTADSIPSPLLDRMELITLSGYITDEKLEIAKRHLIPKLLPKHGLKKSNISFTSPAIREIANSYAREAGVRALEKSIKTIMRKAAMDVAEGIQPENEKVVISPDNLEKYLGKPRFTDDELMKQPEVGVAMGLAWTSLGGATLYIESVAVPGKGELQLTGQLGDVMKESIRIARTVLEANAKTFKIPDKFFKKNDIHVHVPAGATPKDGPSAGITMAVSMLSLATNRTLPRNWAMTGELTLKGRVLPVGGIKEKTIAAKRAGVLDIIMPKANEKDFAEIPDRVRKDLTVHYVEQIDEVFALLFK